jgi:peptidoglycan/xylan/chitin deacetylase (PgdA/CDA1 family)
MNINLYYLVKPFVPRYVQLFLRRNIIRKKLHRFSSIWPIDYNAGAPPAGWKGWPGNKKFALVLTHDVDTQKGHDTCLSLMNIEKEAGFVSSFNFVPERYDIAFEVLDAIFENGFEIGVHGLKHDGTLFSSRSVFNAQAERINLYIKEWGAVGFRAPSMIRNLEWIKDLCIEYDASTFDTDPFEPQPEGAGTIFPFWVQGGNEKKGYVELPYTLCQDFSLYVLMQEKNISVWQKKLDWIAAQGGMALINTHPDYMNFSKHPCGDEEYPCAYYRDFLLYVKQRYAGEFWHVLPKDIARFWKHHPENEDIVTAQTAAQGRGSPLLTELENITSYTYEI